jgi:hypothetical protein
MAQQQALMEQDRQIVALGGDDKAIKTQLLEIDRKRAEILKSMVGATKDVADSARRQMADTVDQARAIQQAVDGALQLAGAFHMIDATTTNVLRSIGQMAADIPVLVSQIHNLGKTDASGNALATAGSVAGAALPIIGAVATLAGSIMGLFHHEDQVAQELAAKHIEAMKSLAAALEKVSQGGGVPSGVNLGDVRKGISTIGGLPGGQGSAGILGDYELQKLAKEFGVTLDGTKESYRGFLALLEESIPVLEKRQEQEREDLHVRELRAKGLNAEADAEAFAEKQEREYSQAVNDHADADTLAALAAAQAAEKTAFLAEQQKKAAQANEDYHVRLLRATGHGAEADAEAFREHQQREWADAVAASGLSADDFAKSANGVALAATQAAEATKYFADAAEAAAQAAKDAADATIAMDADVYGYDPTTVVNKESGAYGIDLSQFDLSTKKGVDAAIQWLQTDYGSATDPVRKQEDKALIDNLRRITFGDGVVTGGLGGSSAAASAIGAGYTSLTSVQGDRMYDIELRSFNVLAQQLELQTDIRDLLKIRMAPPVLTVVQPSGSSASGAGGPTFNINVGGLTFAANQAADATGMGSSLVRAINTALGQQQALNKVQLEGSIAPPFGSF